MTYLIYFSIFVIAVVAEWYLCKLMKHKGYKMEETLAVLAAGVFLLIYFYYKPFYNNVSYYIEIALIIILIQISFIDFKMKLAPDILNLSLLLLGLFNIITHISDLNFIFDRFLGFIVSGGMFYFCAVIGEWILKLFKSKDTMALGGGDIKLIACLGLLLGLKSIVIIILFSAIISLFPMIFLIVKDKSFSVKAPLTPYIGLGVYIVLLLELTNII